ncbi:MAG: DUF456 domain-containing protein [Propionibacteriaceae bacterium]|nr:DUF456 domain-containing protein [Propionibacteriaceae bacterium]
MPDFVVALIAVLLTVVGVTGIVVPVLPGSLAVISGLLVWAIWGGSGAAGWLVFGLGAALVLVGMSAQYLITGRGLKKRNIPSRSVIIGLIAGVIGLFVLPFFGLPIGFAAGLLLSEWWRVRDWKKALTSSLGALKSVGLGMLVELGCALAAATTLLIGVLVHLF